MTNSSFGLSDLPLEIQQLIIWKCLEGWKATVETHQKLEGTRSTTRLWSSVIYDALVLSLTCKRFYHIIQRIQKDPALFSGEIDLIEANAEISYLTGTFSSYSHHDDWRPSDDPFPNPLFRTQIFIKADAYDRTDPCWRKRRFKHHKTVRDWLIHHASSVGLWIDESNSRVPWRMFPNLNRVTVFWPYTFVRLQRADKYVCEHGHDELTEMIQSSENLHAIDGETRSIPKAVEELLRLDLKVTVICEMPHLHQTAKAFCARNGDYNEFDESDFHNLKCTFEIDEHGWTQTSAVCDPKSLMSIDDDDLVEAFAEIFVDDMFDVYRGTDDGIPTYSRTDGIRIRLSDPVVDNDEITEDTEYGGG